MSTPFAYDVFLSHNSKDKPRVRRLAERLHAEGLRVWFDDWVIRAGDAIYLAIEHGLEASRTLLLCMSPAAFDSDWVGLERETVLFRDPANRERRFIPVLLADCDIPATLRRYKYVDYRNEGDAAWRELMEVCRVETEPAALVEVSPEDETGMPLATLERQLGGHTDWVRSVAVSPDGLWAVSGSGDHTVRIWDLETGECRATLAGHKDEVWAVAITPDGQRILSGSDDKTIRVWDVSTGRHLATWEDHKGGLCALAISRDGRRAVSVSGHGDTAFRVWDLSTGTCERRLQGHEEGAVWGVAVTEDGQRALSGGGDQTLRYWDLEAGECLAILKGHADYVKSVQITPDGRYAVSGSDDHTVKLWDLQTATCIGTFEGHQNGVDSVAISPDGTLVASTGFIDGTLRLWDLKTGAAVKVVETGTISPISVAFSPDGSRLLAGTADRVILVYRLSGVHVSVPAEVSGRYTNAKVVLVGESGVGKSGLAHRLIEDKFVKTYSTHGM